MDAAEATEVLRIGAALVLAQTRARESKARADSCERLVRTLAAGTGELPASVADLPAAPSLQASMSSDDWDLLQSIVLEERPSATYSGKVLPPPSRREVTPDAAPDEAPHPTEEPTATNTQPVDGVAAPFSSLEEAGAVAAAKPADAAAETSLSATSVNAAPAGSVRAGAEHGDVGSGSDIGSGSGSGGGGGSSGSSNGGGDGGGSGLLAQWQRWLASMCSELQLRALRFGDSAVERWASSPLGHMLRAGTLAGFLVGLVAGALVSRQRRPPTIAASLGQQLERVVATHGAQWAPVLGSSRTPSIGAQQAVARYMSAVHAPVSV